MDLKPQPAYFINSIAPIRVCDNGGWTDTWFSGHGKIFNIAVSPFVEVQVAVFEQAGERDSITINALDYGDRYTFKLDRTGAETKWGKHPLLEAAIESMMLPPGTDIEVMIHSAAPGGASTGTSAAVTVALVGALDRLTNGYMNPHEVAYAAHRVETEILCQQCGIQDQLCCAYGGINYIEMDAYPHATVSQLDLADDMLLELERRLALIYLGRSHSSSEVHLRVIDSLENAGSDTAKLEELRSTASWSRDALLNADFNALGAAMIENTEAQRRLHPALVCADAEQVIQIARRHGAAGWKVNGAGGKGGSMTLLCDSSREHKRAMIREIEQTSPMFRSIPIALNSQGLQVWKQDAN